MTKSDTLVRIQVHITARQLAKLRKMKRAGLTVAHLIRNAIDEMLSSEERA